MIRGPRWLYRRYFGSCPPEVWAGISQLRRDYPDYDLSGAEIYAAVGRDRGLLDMEFIEGYRKTCEEMREMAAELKAQIKQSPNTP